MPPLLLLASLVAIASAHYALQIPTSLGFDDVLEGTAPCGSFTPQNRSIVSNWAVKGDNIGLLSTHPSVRWEINVALVDGLKFVPLVEPFNQSAGVGEVCFSDIPGFDAWIGQPAVLQLIQHAPDGPLYQCAAIQFIAGGPATVPSGCASGPGVSVASILPAMPPSMSATTSISNTIPTVMSMSPPIISMSMSMSTPMSLSTSMSMSTPTSMSPAMSISTPMSISTAMSNSAAVSMSTAMSMSPTMSTSMSMAPTSAGWTGAPVVTAGAAHQSFGIVAAAGGFVAALLAL